MNERTKPTQTHRHTGQAEVRQTGKGGAGAEMKGGETANRKGVDWQVRPATCACAGQESCLYGTEATETRRGSLSYARFCSCLLDYWRF